MNHCVPFVLTLLPFPPPADARPEALMAIKQEDFGKNLDAGDCCCGHGVAGDEPADEEGIDAAKHTPANCLREGAAMRFFGERAGVFRVIHAA